VEFFPQHFNYCIYRQDNQHNSVLVLFFLPFGKNTTMKKILSISICLGIVLFFGSCSTQMYVSNAVNTPLIKEKGEVHAMISQNDLQAAVGLNRNIAIMANGFYRDYTTDTYQHGGMLGELGLGYYKGLTKNWVAETYVGLGAGRVYKQEQFTDANDVIYTGSFKASGTRLFIQPDLGYHSRFFDIAVASRFSFVKYTRFSSENYPASELKENYLDGNNLTGPLFMFAEPALTMRLGYKYVKLQAQWGLTLNLTSNNIKHASGFSSLGIVVNIAKWYNND
jgi:hypothetical protein